MAQFILWTTMIVPWFILFFLDSKKVKRFISVAFFTIFIASIWWQLAVIKDWWVVNENLFFLTNISAFNYGLMPIATIMVFYFTYERPWLFVTTNVFIQAIQAFVISPFVFEKFGLYTMVNMSDFGLFLLLLSYIPIIYLYQRLYEKRERTK